MGLTAENKSSPRAGSCVIARKFIRYRRRIPRRRAVTFIICMFYYSIKLFTAYLGACMAPGDERHAWVAWVVQPPAIKQVTWKLCPGLFVSVSFNREYDQAAPPRGTDDRISYTRTTIEFAAWFDAISHTCYCTIVIHTTNYRVAWRRGERDRYFTP